MPDETIQQIATVFPIDPEDLKPDPKLRRRVSIIKEYGLNTSTHGIPGIARGQSVQNRTFWSVCTIIFAGIMTYFIVEAILAYFQYPSQTSVSIIVEWPQAFPAVTICNYSPLIYDRFIGPFLNYTNMFGLTNTTDTTNFTYQQSLYIQDFLTYKLNRNESLNDFIFPLDSMMISCNYNGLSCSAANFTSFITAPYGACYTFNAKLKDAVNDGIRTNVENGQFGLLQVSFYTYQNQYVPYYSYASGMVALVHANDQVPTIELAGIFLAPGRQHKLGYAKTTSSFLSAPFTTCNNEINLVTQTMFDQYQGTYYSYSQYACFGTCIQEYVYQKCGCGHPLRWTARFIVPPGTNKLINIPLCNITDPCYTTATEMLMAETSIWANYCPDCTPECDISEYRITPSSLLAPPEFLLNDIKQFVESSTISRPKNWSTTWVSDIQSSYVSLEVAYETTRTQVYSQQQTITQVDVISNVGGQTGLWIGISFLSLMEIIEMTYRLLRYQYYSLRKGVRKRFRKIQITK